VLCIDGGGIRGVVPLSILEKLDHLMIDVAEDFSDTKPADMFDLMVGTSTGGILAVLLGALQLPVPECMEIYRDLSHVIFPSVGFATVCWRLAFGDGAKHNVRAFEEALKIRLVEILKKKPEWQDREINIDEIRMSDFPPVDNKRPKIAVVSKRCNCDEEFLFTNFRCLASTPHKEDEVLWKVLRATAAAPFYFPSIKLGKCIKPHAR
jgi:patatin-like phospholipase/acyl hydrolase